MRVPAVDRTIPAPRNGYVPLHNGDHMDAETFHALYEQTPEGFKAELIGGIVYVASPVTRRHGRPHSRVVHWLSLYEDDTEGVETLTDTTNRLGEDSEPQPDAALRILPEFGGQTSESEGDYILGPSELVVEVAHTTRTIDLHGKKRDCEKAGVLEYLVVLAESSSVRWFSRSKRGFVELRPTDGLVKSRVFPGLWLDPGSLFERSSRKLLTSIRAGLSSPEHAKFVAKLAARRSKDSGAT